MQRSILDFFSKPSINKIIKTEEVITEKIHKTEINVTTEKIHKTEINNANYIKLDLDENVQKYSQFKRLRSISDSNEGDKENKTNNIETKKMKFSVENKNVLEVSECCKSPLKTKSIISKTTTPKSIQSKTSKSKTDLNESLIINDEDTFIKDSYDHLSFEFLKKDSIMDAQRRRPDNSFYDPSSLYIPNDFMSKLTPAMRQWWQMKAKDMNDALLFFKVGKFYELYHMDAVIAVNELGISFMRGSYAHCGFPEIAFTKMADQLVQKGYKVARVEQTETVDVMTERCLGRPTKEKVVNREVCQIVTPGTRTFSLRNSSTRAMTKEEGEDVAFDDNVGAMLYSLKEMPIEDASRNKSRLVMEIGIAVVNTNTGKFMLAQFPDDNQRSKLRTMFARFSPNEVIFQRGDLSKDTQHLLNTTLVSVKKEGLCKQRQFLSSEDALQRLLEGGYFIDTPKSRLSGFGLPIGLTEVLNKGDNLGRSAAPNYTLAVSCLGGLIYYLGKCLIDKYLISLADFMVYHPTDQFKAGESQLTTIDPFYNRQSNMILDSNAIQNLDLLKNSSTGGIEGTLLERLDFTSTSFGKRLLLQWIATPLCHPLAIFDRQAAIMNLMELESRLAPVRQKLKSLPDLEKLLARIHAIGLIKSVSDHPDSRAVLYENIKYSRKKINDFISTISAFKTILSIQSYFTDLNFENKIQSSLLTSLTLCKEDQEMGLFPDLSSQVKYFQEAFNHENAKAEGKIIPEEGVDQEYDASIDAMKEIQNNLDKYLQKQSSLFGCKINYFGTGRNRFQLEIPESKCKNVPRTYIASSQRKGFKRYETTETADFLAEMTSAEERRDVAMTNIMSRIFAKFDEYYPLWSRAIDSLARLDVLMSLSVFSRGVDGGPMSRPDVRELSKDMKPFLMITEGRYPSKAKTQTGEFIANTITLGCETASDNCEQEKRVMLLTGPNMGGKSTLMKQVGLIIVLSQLGCYVPAEGQVILTPVDRLLTRQGASDAIGSGQSTLQVELNETASIMAYMTANSFLIVDELGRGTSTHDGCALAYSILTSIVERCQPRTIFSTHFHKLLEEKALIDTVQLCHMACMVEDDIDDIKLQNITFLYKLSPGSCPKSYGFNVARLANIPEKIIASAQKKAQLFEEETMILEFKRMLTVATSTDTFTDSQLRDQLKMWQSKWKMWQSKLKK